MNYLVEGLQGSGKSTLVQALAQLHPECRAIREGEYAPIELAWCAYLTEEEYQAVWERYPALREEIAAQTYTEGDKKVLCYTKVPAEDRSFYQDLERYEIYNGRLPWETFKALVLSRYRTWAQDRQILECALFQNIVEEMTLFRCATDEEILAFYREVRQALEGKDYHIFYLQAEDLRGNLEVIRRERSDDQGNELWFPLMLGFFNASPYARQQGVQGEEALLRHFQHRQELELRLCREIFPDRVTVLPSKAYAPADLALG